jgi:DNA-directed RNA polymerase specialized sigma24 family protein
VAWVNLGKLRSLDAFGAWLRRIARNLAKNWMRSKRYRLDLIQRRVNRRS